MFLDSRSRRPCPIWCFVAVSRHRDALRRPSRAPVRVSGRWRAVAFATCTLAGPPRGCSPGNAHCALSRPRKTGRSAFQCLQKYQQHNRALKRREWTPEEDHLLTQLVQEMRVGSHIPYRRSESARTHPCRWAPWRPRARSPLRVEAARSPRARRVAQSRVPTPPLCPQLSTTWKGETPCSSSIGGPRAWIPT